MATGVALALKMDTDLDGLRRRVAAARRGRSLDQVSLEVGIFPAELRGIERGELPEIETLARVCLWLGTTIDEFVR